MMDFHGTKCKLFLIYVVMGLRVSILRFLCKYLVYNAIEKIWHQQHGFKFKVITFILNNNFSSLTENFTDKRLVVLWETL